MDVCVLGSINRDLVIRVARFPHAGETLSAAGLARNLGGKGANQAVAAARAGAQVRMIGRVGDDEDGRGLIAALVAEDVDCVAVGIDPERPTGTAHILVDDAGENQIVVVAGANATLRGGDVGSAGILLAQLEIPIDAVARFLSAKAPGATAILNAAPFDPAAPEVFGLADVIVVNETELAGYCAASELSRSPDEAARMARTLLGPPGQRIVVTLGAAGSVTVTATGEERARAPAAAAVVDTTGAGDCFCGYLAAGLASGKSFTEAVALGHRAAAIAVGRHGAATAIPLLADLGPESSFPQAAR